MHIQRLAFKGCVISHDWNNIRALFLHYVCLKGISLFCGLMDISQGLYTKTFDACLESIHITSKALYQVVTRRAVEEEINKTLSTEHPMDYLTVSGDGTWEKRGFSSLFGMFAITGIFTKKVLDSVIKSSSCRNCSDWEHRSDTIEYDIWFESHENQCSAINSSGNTGKMEVDAVTEMFQRSQEKYGVYFTIYVGDGDSETFKNVLNMNPYDDDIVITKKECIRHAEKRIGMRLRGVTRNTEGIGGKREGKLTDELIKHLTTHYSLAIRNNSNSVGDMKRAIWATLYHEASSDANPQHEYCPSGSDSWCVWRQAEAKGTLEAFTHQKPPLHDAVITAIKPVYEDFTADALLERCLGAYTQNSNGSLHSLIWTLVPRHMRCGKKTVEIATFLAICIFNEGFQTILQIMSLMGIIIGPNAKAYVDKRDNQRISRTSGDLISVPHARQSHDEAEELFFEDEEDIFYGPAIAE